MTVNQVQPNQQPGFTWSRGKRGEKRKFFPIGEISEKRKTFIFLLFRGKGERKGSELIVRKKGIKKKGGVFIPAAQREDDGFL